MKINHAGFVGYAPPYTGTIKRTAPLCFGVALPRPSSIAPLEERGIINFLKKFFQKIIESLKKIFQRKKPSVQITWISDKLEENTVASLLAKPDLKLPPVFFDANLPLPVHHRQTTSAGGNEDRYIVNECTTNTLKTLFGFVFQKQDIRMQPGKLADDYEKFLRNIQTYGLTEKDIDTLLNRMNKAFESWDKASFAQSLRDKKIDRLYKKIPGDYSQLPQGMMLFLSRHGFESTLVTFYKYNELGRIKKLTEVETALKRGKPVIALDYDHSHATLYAWRQGKLYNSNPLESNWKELDKFPPDFNGYAIIADSLVI